jgi:hypothetical protein
MLNPQNRQGWSRLLGFFYALYTVPPVLLQALVLTPMVCLWALGRSQAPAGLKRRLVLLSLVVCAVNLGLSLAVLEVILALAAFAADGPGGLSRIVPREGRG